VAFDALVAREEVHVWFALPGALAEADLAHGLRLLDATELARYRRFCFELHRREFLVTHALLRLTLARYGPTEAAAWRFDHGPHGKPSISPPCGLSFNVSNHPSLVVCAVASGAEVGVDVEPLARGPTILELAPTVFSAHERAVLECLAPAERSQRAVSLWTAKEAYIKARGQGLTLPLDLITIAFDERHPLEPRVEVHPSIDDGVRWTVRLVDVEQHRVAVALGSETLRVRLARLLWA
jgi:4'-phosphopantetheinyl transferase